MFLSQGLVLAMEVLLQALLVRELPLEGGMKRVRGQIARCCER
jgi:hypothetical protein